MSEEAGIRESSSPSSGTEVTRGGCRREEVDVTKLRLQEKKLLMEKLLKIAEEDNQSFLRRMRDRIDRVGIEVPKVEVRYENLRVEGNIHVGSRALPTLYNATLNVIESVLGWVHALPSKKKNSQILQGISGIVKPSRMTLLLGPPGAGKTTLLQALSEKLDRNLRMAGRITYCGHEFHEFVPQRTSAYVSQHDVHFGEMTVRETFDFTARCLGGGWRHGLLKELTRREAEAGIRPDPELDAFMKATAIPGLETSLITDYVIKILGLDICADIMVGDEARRGISGGQRRRLTAGEMLVGPARVLFMDEISSGLDSSTAFSMCKFMRQMVHIMDMTMLISLLQPAPEIVELFDDVILLSEGQIVYQGPREDVLEFMEYMGFKCPERKGIADFLQEVTSVNDQEQYWCRNEPYRYISVPEFVTGFNSFRIGKRVALDLRFAYDKSNTHHAALVTEKYGDLSNWGLFKACFAREWLLMKRNSFVYIFKTVELVIISLIAMTTFFRTEMPVGTVEDGTKFYGALFFGLVNVMFNGMAELGFTVTRLPVFYKQRDSLFYPAWAFALPSWVLSIPLSLMESGIWVILTYFTTGFAPAASRFFKQLLVYFSVNQMALSLFRFIGAVGRTLVTASTLATLTWLLMYMLGGFVIARNDVAPWMVWGPYISPMMYGQAAIVMNEFLDSRWSKPIKNGRVDARTVGEVLLKSRGFFTQEYWFWICVGALLGFSLLFNICYILALTYLNPLGDSKTVVVEEGERKKNDESVGQQGTGAGDFELQNASVHVPKNRLILPFQPLSLAFNHVNYYVDMPAEMKSQGVEGERLQLLRDVSGAFRPRVLTALVAVSGAGKTTLMDVLSGRKTRGYIEGSISIGGYPKNQATFARVTGYCEQNDIHSPYVTVYESLLFSAWLRLSPDLDAKARKMFIEEVMELVELKSLGGVIVGRPGVDGLSTEQRKRLTIAVELVANPSIIFMDEPTSGLDARAAAIVMRTVRNTVDTGRTVVCTIHQPSIDIFEAFDELLLMKGGGRVIYSGPLGDNSHKLVEYFEAIPGVPKIRDGYNPATWVLEVTTPSVESQLDLDFAEIYAKSLLYQRYQELIAELRTPAPGSKDLCFPTEYSQSLFTQFRACFWKQYSSYWRNPRYNMIRFMMTAVIGVSFGLIFWDKGQKIGRQQDLVNLFGAMFCAVLFLSSANAYAVQPIIGNERTVYYRERAVRMYSAFPYAFSQVAVEFVYVLIQSFGYSLLLFFMIGFEQTAEKLVWFFYYMFTSFMYFTSYGMMLVALTPGHEIASISMAFFLGLWDLFSGFLIPRVLIPVWWRWYYWLSPVAWTLYGIITSQVGDKNVKIEMSGGGYMDLQIFLKNGLGFAYDFLPIVAVVHAIWMLLFIFVFAYGIKYLNFQER